ncbi:MAG: caspase domain-containing protein [Salibacteraceae bacterium]
MTAPPELKKRALLVGIGKYDHANDLTTCHNDVAEMNRLLEHHADGRRNYHCETLSTINQRIDKPMLLEAMRHHFNTETDQSLLYLTGHGGREIYQSFFMTQEARPTDEGIPLRSIMKLLQRAKAQHNIVIVDACYSGDLGRTIDQSNQVQLPHNCALLTSTAPLDVARGSGGRGVFSYILTEGLAGAAAEPSGWVSVAGLYAQVDRLLSPLQQRPYFRANLSQMLHLRQCDTLLTDALLRTIVTYFPTPNATPACPASWTFPLNRNKASQEEKDLSALFRSGMIEPDSWSEDQDRIRIHAFRLTEQGKHYLRVVRKQ